MKKFRSRKIWLIARLYQSVSEWVSDKHSQWSDSDPIKTKTLLTRSLRLQRSTVQAIFTCRDPHELCPASCLPPRPACQPQGCPLHDHLHHGQDHLHHGRDSFFTKFCHPRSRFWEPKLKTWSRQIMFYVIYPELWQFSVKNEKFGIYKYWGGGPYVSDGPSVVLETLGENLKFWQKFLVTLFY